MLVLPAPMRPTSTMLRPASDGQLLGREARGFRGRPERDRGPMLRVMAVEVSTCLPLTAKDAQWTCS